MRKVILQLTVILLISITSITANAQNSGIKGQVTDTSSKINLQHAVISLLRNKDTVLYKFTRTNHSGDFELNNLTEGKYFITVSYPGYVEYMDNIVLEGNKVMNIGKIALVTKAHLLEDVVVRQKIAAIRMKGDTLEFMADSFKVREGASVEDLLKKFPGFTVNSKGEITAQGQKIEKVLVDGDEFFGDDPTMATRNLNAKDVAKVQMFDKTSDQSSLTGIDDGQKKKTLNLILKEDAKKGYFGQAQAGTDFNKYYQGKANFNRFTSTLKAGAYVSADRTGKNEMSWNEMQDFGGVTTVADGGSVIMYSEGDDFSNYNNQGIPENLVTAAMLNKKFGPYKSSTASNYSYKEQTNAGQSITRSQYILPDTVYYNNQTQQFNNHKWQHAVSTRNEFNIDSLNTITVNAKGSWGYNSDYSNFISEYLNSNQQKVNTSNRTNNSTGDKNAQKADLFFKHKFNKAGTRALTVNGTLTNNSNNSDGYLYTETDFYKNGIVNSAQVVNQHKIGSNNAKGMQALISYT
jgi:hypothetical protein